MTIEQVTEAIEQARQAVNDYKQETGMKTASGHHSIIEEIEKDDAEESLRGLLKEAFEAGLAGTPCRRCGGTGQEP